MGCRSARTVVPAVNSSVAAGALVRLRVLQEINLPARHLHARQTALRNARQIRPLVRLIARNLASNQTV